MSGRLSDNWQVKEVGTFPFLTTVSSHDSDEVLLGTVNLPKLVLKFTVQLASIYNKWKNSNHVCMEPTVPFNFTNKTLNEIKFVNA